MHCYHLSFERFRYLFYWIPALAGMTAFPYLFLPAFTSLTATSSCYQGRPSAGSGRTVYISFLPGRRTYICVPYISAPVVFLPSDPYLLTPDTSVYFISPPKRSRMVPIMGSRATRSSRSVFFFAPGWPLPWVHFMAISAPVRAVMTSAILFASDSTVFR
jgi:hypothetical protein